MNPVLEALAVTLQDPPPWWLPYLAVGRNVLNARADSVADALDAARARDAALPRFVAHTQLPAGESYESFIARTGCVPTRDNLHDLFNGIVWLTWPQAKRRLNRLQADAISRQGIANSRGPLRDALTVFDENAAVLQASAELTEALRQRDWQTLFVAGRAQWRSARLMLFGHALLEKLLQPRKPITAHVWLVSELSDAAIAASLDPLRLTTKPFLPLPVLGVPGWCELNERPGFYEDADVFRTKSSREKRGG